MKKKRLQEKGEVLLDSNILVYILRNDERVWQCVEQVGWRRCCVSEISIVELLYGVEYSAHPEKNRRML